MNFLGHPSTDRAGGRCFSWNRLGFTRAFLFFADSSASSARKGVVYRWWTNKMHGVFFFKPLHFESFFFARVFFSLWKLVLEVKTWWCSSWLKWTEIREPWRRKSWRVEVSLRLPFWISSAFWKAGPHRLIDVSTTWMTISIWMPRKKDMGFWKNRFFSNWQKNEKMQHKTGRTQVLTSFKSWKRIVSAKNPWVYRQVWDLYA